MSDNPSVVEDTDAGVMTTTARKKKKPVDSTRFRISVPNADASVIEWIEHQNNLSYSIRHLIHEAIQRKGMVDATCESKLHKVNRGRPNKQNESVDEYSYVSSDDVETEVVEPVQTVVPEVPQNMNPTPVPIQPQVTQQMPVAQPVVQPMPAQAAPMQRAAASASSPAASSLLSSL